MLLVGSWLAGLASLK